jgi:sensor histidine kinase YesM
MSDVITLDFEIEMLKRYLEIEDLRFEENIKSNISVHPGITPSSVKIPIMMIQPFVENAIWHGLLNKQGEKLINISFEPEGENYIKCTVEDNGTGRKKENEMSERRSLATGFIEQRLNLLNRIHKLNCSLKINDKAGNAGTIVQIILPILKR